MDDKSVGKIKEEVVLKEITRYPALQSLSANVSGRVEEVGDDYFKISNGTSIISLRYERNGVTEFKMNPSGEEIALTDLRKGDLVTGGVTMIISPENALGLTNKSSGDIVAHFFTVERVPISNNE